MKADQILAVLVSCALLYSGYAFGCGCSGHPTNEEDALAWIESSEVVMLVRIDEHSQKTWAEESEVKHDDFYTGVVVEGFKGIADGAAVYVQTNYNIQSCAVRYRPSDTYLVFGQGPRSDGRVHATLCRSFPYKTTQEAAPSHHELLKSNLELVLQVLRKE